MLKNIKTAWKLPEVRSKLLFTLLLVVIFRLGVAIPVPGVNALAIKNATGGNTFYSFMNLMSGGAFENYSLFALGVQPYINASIIMQLLTIAFPALENMQKEGEEGRKKIERITRLLGMVFALIMSVGLLLSMGEGVVVTSQAIPAWLSYATIGMTITAGTAFLIWLSEKMTEVGIGNGTSFIIFVGMVAGIPGAIKYLFSSVAAGTLSFWVLPLLLILVVVVIIAVIFVDLGQRKIPVQYSKRVVGRKMYGGQASHIPLKVNANGVMPLIFASTFMQIPLMIAQFMPNSGFGKWYVGVQNSASYMIIYFLVNLLLIFGFAYFYSSVSFNPIETSKNLQSNGGYIPGIRPGRPTSDFLSKVTSRLTFFSGAFLAIIASVPTLFRSLGSGAQFGATSVLIMVSVALETANALEAQISMRHYKGFLK